jgi:hypothetical protein
VFFYLRKLRMAGCRRLAQHGGTKNFDPSPAILTASRGRLAHVRGLGRSIQDINRACCSTVPNELGLFPLRLNVSLHAKGIIDDAELQDMVRRDISVILTCAPALKSALVAAYKSALPPGYLGAVRAGYP